jgi:diguanylate cyclase (GGDEF)-like protein
MHFAGNEMDLPGSYDCQLIPVKPGRALLLAHRVPPVDDSTAKGFVKLTNALSTANRDLQLAQEELGMKQIELEESLAKLEQLARTDELTSLPNRREILSQLENETYRAVRYQTPLAVMLIDLDHFKFINDRFGHDAGDLALKETALLMLNQIRRTDTVGRYGGEEFLGVLPETTSQPAMQLANRLRACIAEAKISIGTSQTIQLTVSVGVASFHFDTDSPETILKQADMALYRAKALGRNQACFWEGTAD